MEATHTHYVQHISASAESRRKPASSTAPAEGLGWFLVIPISMAALVALCAWVATAFH